MDKSAFELFNLIYHSLYIDNDHSDEQVQADCHEYSKFLATPVGFDAFDGWLAFLIEDEHRGRYIWKETRLENSEVFVVDLRKGKFDEAIELFLHEVEKL